MSYPSYPGPSEPSGQPHTPQQQQPPYGPPQQYYPVEPAPAPTPVGGLGTAAIWVAVLLTVYEVVEAALAWQAQSALLEAADEGNDLNGVWTAYDFAALAYLPVVLAAYVVTCLWLYRVRVNAETLRPTVRHARARGWVWGGWLCPIVSFWFPHQVVRDASTDNRGTTAPRLNAWWGFLLSSVLFERLGLAVVTGQSDVDPDAYAGLGFIETVNAGLVVVAFVLWARIVRYVSDDQDRLILGPARPLTA